MSYTKHKKELKETITWECPNKHWSRVELTFADGIETKPICPICKLEMRLQARMLEPMRTVVYNDYQRGFNNSLRTDKGGGKRAKDNRKDNENASRTRHVKNDKRSTDAGV